MQTLDEILKSKKFVTAPKKRWEINRRGATANSRYAYGQARAAEDITGITFSFFLKLMYKYQIFNLSNFISWFRDYPRKRGGMKDAGLVTWWFKKNGSEKKEEINLGGFSKDKLI